MHLQAWDPYYFSPFCVWTKLGSYSLVGIRISSPHCSLLFSFFSINYTFRFLFVNSCLSRSYSCHSRKGKPFSAKSLLFFLLFFFHSFRLLCWKFRLAVQFCSSSCQMAYCFVFPYFRLCPHRVILRPAETFKTEIPFCSFRIWLICRYIPLAPDQCLPTFLWLCHLQMLQTSCTWAGD